MPGGGSASLRIGVIGIGFGQHVLVPALRADSRCDVRTICASRPDRAQAVAARLGVSASTSDWQTVVADPAIEVVAIAVPPAVQPAIAIAAAGSGKHLFCEKPLARSAAEAADILSAARRAGISHAVDFEFMTIEAWQEAKRLLDAGTIGRLRHVAVTWHLHTRANRLGLVSWKTSVEQGGGTLNLFVSHTFFYLEWLAGSIQSLSAMVTSSRTGDPSWADTSVVLSGQLYSGAVFSASVCSDAPGGARHRVELSGEEGALILENLTSDYVNGFTLWRASAGSERMEPVPLQRQPPMGDDGRIGPVSRLVSRFIDAVQGRAAAFPIVDDGIRVQRLLEAAREAARTGARVAIPAAAFPLIGSLRAGRIARVAVSS